MTGKSDLPRIITIEGYQRAGSAGQGGPAWDFTTTDGDTWRMPAGTPAASAVGNPGLREGCHVEVTVTPGGRIRGMRRLALVRLDSDANGDDSYTLTRADGRRHVIRYAHTMEEAIREDFTHVRRIVFIDTRYDDDGRPAGGDLARATLRTGGQGASAFLYTEDGRKFATVGSGIISPAVRAAVLASAGTPEERTRLGMAPGTGGNEGAGGS